MARGVPLSRRKFHDDVKRFVGTVGSRRIGRDAWGVNKELKKDVETENVVIMNPTTNRWVPRNEANDVSNRAAAADHKTPYETNEDTMTKRRGRSRVQMDSTAIEKIEYEPERNLARVWYKGQKNHYNYNVSPEEMQDFLKADSPGRHVAKEWNGNPYFYTSDRS